MFPILFDFGPFTVYSLWVAVALAFIVSTMLFLKKAKYERLNLFFLTDHSFSLLLGALVGSRLSFFLSNWGYFGPFSLKTMALHLLSFWEPGFSFWGGVLGFSLIFLWQARRTHEPVFEWLNAALTPFFIGIMIGNSGQLLDGQGYGKETILPWGITFESTTVKYAVPVHPTQLYSILLIGIILLSRKTIVAYRPELNGATQWTLFALTAYSLGRFILEWFRGDDTLEWGFIRVGYVAALIGFVFFGNLLYKTLKKSKPEASKKPMA